MNYPSVVFGVILLITIPGLVFGAGPTILWGVGDALCLAGGLFLLISVILPSRRFPPGSRFLSSSPFRRPEARQLYLRIRKNVLLACIAFSVIYLLTTIALPFGPWHLPWNVAAYIFASLVLLPIAIALVYLGMRLVSIHIEPKMENPINDFFVPFTFGLAFYGMVLVGLVWMGGVLGLYLAFLLWYTARRAYPPDVMKYPVDIRPTQAPIVRPQLPPTTKSASGARPPESILHKGKREDRAFCPELGLHILLFLPVAISFLFLAFDPFSALVYSAMMVVVLGALLVNIGFDRIFPMKLREPFKDPEVRRLRSRCKGIALWGMLLLFAPWMALLSLVIFVPTMHSQLISVIWGMDALILIPAGIILIFMSLFKRSAHRLAGKKLAHALEMNIPLAVFPVLIVLMVLIITEFWQGGTLLIVHSMIFAGLTNWNYRAKKKGNI